MAIIISESIANQGLDLSSKVPWQMVPLLGSRILKISGNKGLTVSVRDPAKLSVSESLGSIKLNGLKEGVTYIDWRDPNGSIKPIFTLEVSIKSKKNVRTAFYYINDGKKQISTRDPANIKILIDKANEILINQANVSILKKSSKVLKIKKNLGKVVRFSSHLKSVKSSQHEWDDIQKHVDKTADFTVFFVASYEQDLTPLIDNANAGTIASQKMCILEDNPSSADSARTLAHETVHLLTKLPHKKKGLMGPAGSGRKLNKQQINKINRSAVSVAK